MKKILIYTLVTFTAYYLVSVYFTKNNQFVQYYISNSRSKNESIKKNIFITDKLNVLFVKDSANIIKNNFNFWLDKSEFTRQYGILPIKWKFTNEKINSININFKPTTSNYIKNNVTYKINNNKKNRQTMSTYKVDKNELIKVEFYFQENIISIVEIKINPSCAKCPHFEP